MKKNRLENRGNRKRNSSPLWLVIILSGIVVLLVWLQGNIKYQKTIKEFNEELIKINQEVEKLKLSKEEEIDLLREEIEDNKKLNDLEASPSIKETQAVFEASPSEEGKE
ncbi:hypothetical protein COT75_01460 [Candidatus Beckwithbacteria bacterium CG10_big_fil_rev_8_21_14_0_10_34_10]|uniref:Uncharacterized protein n=1 Tax=Candidatus Beckwithbacteria bacterium CG10_big_fil_rev_8_21_14_0_10_34_10 TaxID=1974495 RepID=A0A2H0WBZ1_9BACT|nr:MAG: hypothetical protein COT75_01460 [Candidatus Beckwithbacteria bacterium CG10_big_fil_rev_8_21_14_0_10_34_10]